MRSMPIIWLAVLTLVQAAIAAPRIDVPIQFWDFGYVPQQSTVSHAYWVKNTGDDTLRITGVKPG